MEKNITKLSPQKVPTSSDVTASQQHGERSPSSGVSTAKSPENFDKKVSSKEVDIPTAPAHFESLETDVVSQDDEEEELHLRLQSSDDETFEDTVEDVSELKENKTSAVEKYFSDIESSDDSQVYEPTSVEVASVKTIKAVSDVCKAADTNLLNKEKSEPDFEPVESEEDFEESRSQEEDSIALPMEDDSFDTGMQSPVEEDSNGRLEAEISATILSDEEEREIEERTKEEKTSSKAALNNNKEASTLHGKEKSASEGCILKKSSVLGAVDVADSTTSSPTTVELFESDDIPELPEETDVLEGNDPPRSPLKSQELTDVSDDSLLQLETKDSSANEQESPQNGTEILEESVKDNAMEVDTDIPSLDVEDKVSAQVEEASSESANVIESQEAVDVDNDLPQKIEETDSNKMHIAVEEDKQSETLTDLLNKPLGETDALTNEKELRKSLETVEISAKSAEVSDEDDELLENSTQLSTIENSEVPAESEVLTETIIKSSKAAEKSEASADLTDSEVPTEMLIKSSKAAEKSGESAEDSTESEVSLETFVNYQSPSAEKAEASANLTESEVSTETFIKLSKAEEKSEASAEDSSESEASTETFIKSTKEAEKSEASADLTESEVSTATFIKSSKAVEKSEAKDSTESEVPTESSITLKAAQKSEGSAEDSTGNYESLDKAVKPLETSTKSLEIQRPEENVDVPPEHEESENSVDMDGKSQGHQTDSTNDEESLNKIEKIPNAAERPFDDKSSEDSIGDGQYLKNDLQTLETAEKDEESQVFLTETEKPKAIGEEHAKSLGESVKADETARDLVTDETFLDEVKTTTNEEKPAEDLNSPKKDTTPSDISMDSDENSAKTIDATTSSLIGVDETLRKPEKSVSAEEQSEKTKQRTSEATKAPESGQKLDENVEDPTEKSVEKSTELDEQVEGASQEEKSLDKSSEDSEKSEKITKESNKGAPSVVTAEKSIEKLKESESIKETASSTLGSGVQDEGTQIPSQILLLKRLLKKPVDAEDIENVVAKEQSIPDLKDKPHSAEENDANQAKKTQSIEPEIIEIDDDDLEDDKKEAHTTATDEKPVPIGKKADAPADKPQPVHEKSLSAVPIEKTTEKAESPTEKPAITAETVKVAESAVPQDIEMLEIVHDDKTDNSKPKQLPVGDATMRAPETASAQATPDDDESLLVIDTSHTEDNEPDDLDMDTETEQTATSAPTTTDSSSEGSLEVFYDKECVHYECKHGSKNFYRATLFTLNYYKISKKRNKAQYVCEECYDRALSSYEEMCKTLTKRQPLLHGATFKGQEFVEIIDSSEEDDDDDAGDNFKDENALPKDSIELLEAELEGAIRKVMHNVDIQSQLSWTKQILQQRLNNLQEDTEFVSVQLRQLQKKADNMHNSLYQCPKIKIRQLTPLDLNSGRTYNPETESTIPPMGEVLRTSIHVNETYYAVKNKAIASWVPCKVIDSVDGYNPYSKNQKHYKIKFLKSKYPMLKTVSAKHMAFFNPPKVRLPIGTRVIAYFDVTSLSRGKEKMLIPSAFYPGIIAEPLKQSNKFRYLVFYDDGYFQYVNHNDVRLVCQASENVWEDVHHQSREFIHNYLTQYAVNRPMVQTQKGQSMLVDYNGKWIYARVIDVDCSLVQMLFEGQSRSEWIYRGSTRLGPVYKESNNLVQKNQTNTSRLSRRTEPFIRYINGDDSSSSQQSQEPPQQSQPKSGEVRSVAKKSVSKTDNSHQSSQPVPTVRHLNNSTIFVDDDNKPKGKVVYYTARKNLPPRDYEPHICSPTCPFNVSHNLSFYSPLAKPLLSGWERQVFRQKAKKFIVYRGPCGKRLRSMEELHRYLRVTENELNVDNFDFSAETNCLAEYVIESCIVQKKDISNGKEKMPIPCVNYYDNTMPPDCVYSSRRIPTEGVPLNLDKDFLVGCDCEDDCSDKSKCACWELTYAGAKYGMPNVPNEMVGYQYKRLYEHVPTGIYECNARCKCKANCVNRVVQQPLQSKLQVFKTSNRGWGLRCINDVPRGSFICIYAGHLLNEQKANEGGLDAGDEYFAELDYIEVAEQIKEGYESDVAEPDEDEDLYNPEKEDEDDDEFVAPSESHRNRSFNTRSRSRRSTKNSSDVEHDSQERQVISFEPNKTMGQPDNSTSEKPTIRKLFGKDEACYIMDAKITGNLGRYFNHSCSPNLFVQNVFVDTHDLRFPWVAFFAFTHIRAGTELTWNYNYEVGVVPGKVLYCQCGAPNCRQRLL